ncbi:MAG: hypothetical protein QM783_14475 [Phycisphaerales bacterium]
MTLPRPIPILIAGLGGVTILTALAGVAMAVMQRPPAWFFLGFEVVVVLAAVFLILLGIGRIKEGPAITLICAAGAIGAGSLLGWQATGKQINGHSITWLVGVRGLIAAVLVLAAAADVALRAPSRTFPKIGWGLVFAFPLLGGLACWKVGLLGSVIGRVAGNSQPLAFGLWMVVGIIGGVLLSAAGHLLITGFQAGVKASDEPAPAPKPATPSSTTPANQPPSSSTSTGTAG